MESIKGKKIQYINCDKGQLHEGEALNYICIDDKCKHKGLMCSICLNQDHEKHKYMPLKIFLSQLQKGFSQNFTDDDNIEAYLEQIETLQQMNLYTLKEGVQKLSDDVKKLEEQLIETYKSLKNKVISQSFMSKNAPQVLSDLINGEYTSAQKIKEDCRQLVDSVKQKDDSIYFDVQPKKIVDAFKVCQTAFTKQYQEFQKTFNENFEKLGQILENTQNNQIDQISTSNIEFEISTEFDSSKWVTIKQNKIDFKFRNEGSYTHIHSKKTFKNSDKVNMKFKLTNYKYHNPSHFWIGICLNKDKKMNFWKSSGNQIDIIYKSNNWKNAWTLTGQCPGNIIKEGTVLEFEFCVKDNHMLLQDSEKKSICKITPSSAKLLAKLSDSDEWSIVMGTHKSDISVEIL